MTSVPTAHAPLTEIELARIEALLDRLDPRIGETCTVPGCVHVAGACAGHQERDPVSLAA
ncbi:MAG: hypothetical protein MUE51_07300 [Thermoleophilia bacterium]|jgi:hypothetical protein|nr:hypothetical protein [Thermoleophilia bacterium]